MRLPAVLPPFDLGPLPSIHFGAGAIARLPELGAALGRHALLVTGATSLRAKPQWDELVADLDAAGLRWEQVAVSGEPRTETIDTIVTTWHGRGIDLVIGIGGGSVLDAAKAVAGLLVSGDPVGAYLEGVGDGRAYAGPALPLVAAPTTAGTGSEATRNAVVGGHDPAPFKKSFRHPSLVPRHAVVDPDLLIGCPFEQLAANAMDALTQLVESYTSTRAGPLTDALAESGLAAIGRALGAGLGAAPDAAQRHDLAYASLLSGICLAHTGLGAVHGLAAPLGARFPIPHGVACGATLAAATDVNLAALRQRAPDSPALARYARVAELLDPDREEPALPLERRFAAWTRDLQIPGLRRYGLEPEDYPAVVAGARGNSMQTNPVALEDAELTRILSASA